MESFEGRREEKDLAQTSACIHTDRQTRLKGRYKQETVSLRSTLVDKFRAVNFWVRPLTSAQQFAYVGQIRATFNSIYIYIYMSILFFGTIAILIYTYVNTLYKRLNTLSYMSVYIYTCYIYICLSI